MAIPLMKYTIRPVYIRISRRFSERYQIRLSDHIDSMSHVSDRNQEGITFVPTDAQRFIKALEASRAFHHDNRGDFVGQVAASATTGEGYREIAKTSLHCQVGKLQCNVHIDYIGFIWQGPKRVNRYTARTLSDTSRTNSAGESLLMGGQKE